MNARDYARAEALFHALQGTIFTGRDNGDGFGLLAPEMKQRYLAAADKYDDRFWAVTLTDLQTSLDRPPSEKVELRSFRDVFNDPDDPATDMMAEPPIISLAPKDGEDTFQQLLRTTPIMPLSSCATHGCLWSDDCPECSAILQSQVGGITRMGMIIGKNIPRLASRNP
jgi:hypothetical protein